MKKCRNFSFDRKKDENWYINETLVIHAEYSLGKNPENIENNSKFQLQSKVASYYKNIKFNNRKSNKLFRKCFRHIRTNIFR